MTHVGPAPGTSGAIIQSNPSFVEWGAVLAGAVLAAALSFVLLTFGTAIGLSATSPWPNSGVSTKVLAGVAVFWVMAQQIATFMAGGYVAGRLRSRWTDANQDEAEFRDGLHGGLVWAVGVVIGAALLMASAGAATRTGVELAGKAVGAAASPMDAVLDTMLRPMTVAQASTAGTPTPSASPAGSASSGQRAANTGTASQSEMRAEVSRILASAVAGGSMTEPNRTYVAQLVSQRTGLSQQEAEKRVTDAVTSAREAADKARKGAILTGFVAAASLLISFGAAWWAATRGGNHRDNSVPARFDLGFPRRR